MAGMPKSKNNHRRGGDQGQLKGRRARTKGRALLPLEYGSDPLQVGAHQARQIRLAVFLFNNGFAQGVLLANEADRSVRGKGLMDDEIKPRPARQRR